MNPWFHGVLLALMLMVFLPALGQGIAMLIGG